MTRRCRLAVAAALVLAMAGTATAQEGRWPTEKPPVPLQAKAMPFPPYETRTLGNGLRVVVVALNEQPVVSAQLLVMAGSALDPPGKGGVASLVAALLDQGSTTRTAVEIAAAVDAAGAELTVTSGLDATFAQMTVLADGLAFGLETLSSVVRTPSFPREELERQRQQLRAALRVSYADPAYLADAVFARLAYGRHPYGRPLDGTPESTSSITRNDLVAFHRQHYVPGRCILAIVGDVDAPRAFAEADRVFGGWEMRSGPDPMPAMPLSRVAHAVVVDIPDAEQTEIRVGAVAIPRGHAQALPLDIAVRALGGDGDNRLLRVLRTKRVMGDHVAAAFDAHRDAGVVRVSARTAAATSQLSAGSTIDALHLIVDEWRRLALGGGVTDEALDPVKARAAGREPLGFETPGSISTRVLTAVLHGRPLEELGAYGERIRSLTAEPVKWAAVGYLPTSALTVVVVGHAGNLAPELRKAGLGDVRVIRLSALDLDADDLLRGASPLPAPSPPSPVSRADWVRARAVLSFAAQAAGGVDLIRNVTTLRAEGDTVMHTPAGPLAAQSVTVTQFPDRLRIQLTRPAGPLVQVYNAGHAWLSDSHGPRDASEGMRRDFAALAARDWITLFKGALADELTGRRLTDETGPGGKTLAVAEVWSDRLPPVRVAVDAASGRLVRISYQVPGPAGPETVDELFDDFHVAGGILMPHRIVTRRDGVAVLEKTLSALTVNPVLPAGLFDKPR